KPNHVATASIKKPIHNVKERAAQRASSYHRPRPVNRFLHPWNMVSRCLALQRSLRLRKADRPPPLMRRKPENADAFGGD
ncbi:hypothetical protein, partial [Sphingobium fuliginis]|uniref:hypothetical protein n=1 Tax=Sphingobium fuliginis (strain ATCC 27551) TaxID=336203 RepID=UPI001C30A620